MKNELYLLKEGREIVNSIHHRQEETDAKLEALSMDVHQLHGEMKRLEEHLQFNTYKIAETELEIFRLKKQ